MTGNSQLFANILGVEHIMASLMLLCATLQITRASGLKNRTQKLIFFRRGLYCLMVWGFFSLGVIELLYNRTVSFFDFLSQSAITISAITFPMRRAYQKVGAVQIIEPVLARSKS